MKKTSQLCTVFGVAYALAIFEAYFTAGFDHSAGLNPLETLVAALVGAVGAAIGRAAGQRMLASRPDSDRWQFDVRRWSIPFGLALVMPPLAGQAILYLMAGNPALVLLLTVANFVLTPVLFALLAMKLERDRLAHVCFSALAIWAIQLPFSLMAKQPLQLWFAAFTSMGLLAIAGYLIAQGVNAVRSRAVAL
ncbi:hypothetical protein ACS7SF_09860 [Ralstonia sp. 25C]|uniref:hypothetical protein n=1 Tax=Ralstonia sp. 25C TaxID=3447363 RepID=UPI003F75324D